MTRGTAIALVMVVLLAGPARPDSCVECHALLPEPLGTPVEQFAHDVHAGVGSCAGCHGGDPSDDGESAMDPAKGFVGKPAPAQIPEFCGRCHADKAFIRRFDPNLPTAQLAEYRTSRHGIALAEGNERAATCISCHGVHGIRPVTDARSPVYKTKVAATCGRCHASPSYMAGTGLPTNQLAQYQRSVHGRQLLEHRDLAAPTCNDCHGNHGAYPPGADSIAAVCGRCHVIQREFFLESPHYGPFEALGVRECSNHHGHHDVQRTSDAMVGVGPLSTCVTCHETGTAGYASAAAIGESIAELREEIERAESALEAAAHAGMPHHEADFELSKAREALVQVRNLVHTADAARIASAAATGLETAQAVEAAGRSALAELRNRRWLAIIPLTMIVIVAALLWVKIRRPGPTAG